MAVGPGTILDERYRVDEVLGNGGMGAVWRGHDPRLNRKVAIKVLRSDHPDPQLISRFRREAEILGNLNHAGITVAYDCGQHDGQFFIVMELLEGSDLAAILESRSGGLPVARTVALAVQAAKALAAAHGKGVVHRDIKPSNLFIVSDDHLKLCDFGIAKWVGGDRTRTQPGLVMGTPAYMSPEQSGSADAADELSDLYSLGCVVYEMLTGFPPFGRAHDWARVDRSQWDVPPQSPRGIEPVPPELTSLILGLLQRDRTKRPRSASVVAEKLREIETGRVGGRRRQEQPRGQEAPRADRPRNAPPPHPITAAELRAMGPESAADYLEKVRSPDTAADALNDMKDDEVAAILRLLSHARAAAFLEVLREPVHAARILGRVGSKQQAGIAASFRKPNVTGLILDAMPPATAARLTASLEERFLAHALVVMERSHALDVLDAIDMGRRKIVMEHLMSADDAGVLHALAKVRLSEAEKRISAAQARAQLQAARRQRQAELLPWSISVASSAWLLAATTVAFDVGATALNWESWPWLFLFIPVALLSVTGAIAAVSARFTQVRMAALAAALFLTASAAAVLLVLRAVPGDVGIPLVVVAPLIGGTVVTIQLGNEDAHRRTLWCREDA
ncbi:hypothetical protein EAS64_21545 [Trebonia kvetii]|uniref:non-specific serine/threonine protein kinase n=1 Tax=Trebonia kvetii TaxID=2480626 RepID=A0A6P2C0S0_9ACTN|nr:protein kinase [Trebonia kvetii]TVZ03043.1 hypothetical protein EAS64_21545 [Trebonia kvetii]